MMAIHTLLFILLFCALVEANGDPDPQYWTATTVVTETVWTMCTAEETETVDPKLPINLLDSKLTCTQVFENIKVALTTSIILPNAILTSVVVEPPASPTSCYSLPTPISSLDVIAFAANQITTDSSKASDPVFFYVGNNATSPEYVGTLIDGNRVLL
ncbi:hypothetical protein B0T21DRAFT_195404 [Apiosordaria backusii]|uniref:Uncharacterized protein n=1 Tax=Apiosordaria backusii TaxID=314023 RepID=A0AA40BDW0_9PEZI|nr:hypothetical protein B0T21DRAFT_195404 [Apiosordaria backusii]